MNGTVNLVTFLESHVIIIDFDFVKNFELSVEDDQLARDSRNSEVFVVFRPCSCENSAINKADLAPLLLFDDVDVPT